MREARIGTMLKNAAHLEGAAFLFFAHCHEGKSPGGAAIAENFLNLLVFQPVRRAHYIHPLYDFSDD
jgi:hypothetical protein